MTKKYEILEVMLTEMLEHKRDMEDVLGENPEYAHELRPLLEAALFTEKIASENVPNDLALRGRTRLLEQAAQMREATTDKYGWFFNLKHAAVMAGLIFVFWVSGAGLINVSASALPGDSLYPVKRSWEQARYWFADKEKTANLTAEYEDARRSEVYKLLDTARLADVRFGGVVTYLDGNRWDVADVPVVLSDNADVDNGIDIGSVVIVTGQTQLDGTVLADSISLDVDAEDRDALPFNTAEDNPAEGYEIETPEEDDDDDEVDIKSSETPEPDDDEDKSGESGKSDDEPDDDKSDSEDKDGRETKPDDDEPEEEEEEKP